MINKKVKLIRYANSHFDSLNYELGGEQAVFTSDIDYCINKRRDLEDRNKQVITIMYENVPVGFFVLDIGKDKLKLTENNLSILLRSLSINPLFQGKGIAQLSMSSIVLEYIKENFPLVNEIVLSVNFKNKVAYKTYIKSGFVDNKKIIIGEMGPQNVLSKKI